VCTHRAYVCTALINGIPTGQGREVSSGCCRAVSAGDMGARSALACSAPAWDVAIKSRRSGADRNSRPDRSDGVI